MSAADLAVFGILMRSLARVNSSLAFCLRKYKSSPFEDYTDLSSLHTLLNTVTTTNSIESPSLDSDLRYERTSTG